MVIYIYLAIQNGRHYHHFSIFSVITLAENVKSTSFGCKFFIYHVRMIDVNVSKVLKEISTNFCSFYISKWLPLEQDL